MRRRSTRGISDVVATVIIVAATVAIALIAVAYFTGIVGGSTNTQRAQITPVSRICNHNSAWYLLLGVQNTGGKDILLSAVQVNGNYVVLTKSAGNVNDIYYENGTKVSNIDNYVGASGTSIPAGETFILNVSITGTYTSGSTYHVDVYTSGNIKLLSSDLQSYDTCIKFSK